MAIQSLCAGAITQAPQSLSEKIQSCLAQYEALANVACHGFALNALKEAQQALAALIEQQALLAA